MEAESLPSSLSANKSLWDAVSEGDLIKAQTFFTLGADINAQMSNGSQLIHCAAQEGRLAVVELARDSWCFCSCSNKR